MTKRAKNPEKRLKKAEKALTGWLEIVIPKHEDERESPLAYWVREYIDAKIQVELAKAAA